MGSEKPTDMLAAYDLVYAHHASVVQTEVRREVFGKDIGQNSWTTAEEFRRFIGWLALTPDAHVLDVASGPGGPSLFLAQEAGCRVTGIDVNENGVANANRLVSERGMEGRVRFVQADAGQPLAFADATFDALLCIDAINHFPDRPRVLAEWWRVLRPGGGLLFTDPITVTGILTNEEIAVRSSIWFFLFAPDGADDRLVRSAGFEIIRREDTTETMALVARRWHDAREHRRDALLPLEGAKMFDGLQKFWVVAHTLAAERRLSRFVFHARKPQTG